MNKDPVSRRFKILVWTLIILVGTLIAIAEGGIKVIGTLEPKNNAFDKIVEFENVGFTNGANYSFYFGDPASGDSPLTQDVLGELLIGSIGQYLKVNGAANGYTWDTITHADMDFTGWTGVNSITTLGTIGTGMWQSTDIGVAYGGTGTSSFTNGGILLGSGTSPVSALGVLPDGTIVVGDGATNPTTLAAFTSSTGELKHEFGGLEANVSGYVNGIYGMASGVTLDIDTSAEVAAAISDETGTGKLTFATSPTLDGVVTIEGTSDLQCDPINGTKKNLFLGTDVAGADTISHSSGEQGWGLIGIGQEALYSVTTGRNSIAIGYKALYGIADNVHCISIGNNSMDSLSTNADNCLAIGNETLRNVGINGDTIAIGYRALRNCTSGSHNTAVGVDAFLNLSTGAGNTAMGQEAGEAINGNYNTLIGEDAILNCTVGSRNTVLGGEVGATLLSGSDNILIGYNADVPSSSTSNYLNIDGILRGWIDTGYIGIGTRLYHIGDEDTYHDFGANLITSTVGGYYSIYEDTSEVVVNNDSRDKDFRVESDNDVAAFFVEGSTDRIGMGTSTPDAKLEVNGAIASGTSTITASSDATDVSGVNTLFVDLASDALIGAFVGGVNGQVLNIVVIQVTAYGVSLEHNEGTGNQNLFLQGEADSLIFQDFGGWTMICNGTSWYEVQN